MSEGKDCWCDTCREYVALAEACVKCGGPVERIRTMTKVRREEVRYAEWFEGVRARGELGPSPGGAAAQLGCTRQMVHHLIKTGVLKANRFKGRWWDLSNYVYVSQRSIDEVKATKERTGRLTPAREVQG